MIIVFISFAVLIFVLGRVIRTKVEREGSDASGKEYLKGLIRRRYSHNKGAIMNLGDNHTNVVVIASTIIFVICLVWYFIILPKKLPAILKAGLTMIVGGAAGNIYERIRYGYVTDYFSFSFLKRVIFNVSDMFIIVGALITALTEIALK